MEHTAAPRRPTASGRFEVYSWFFMRISGLALVLLVLVHFGVMHLYYGVMRIDWSVVAMRYQTPFWRMYDLLLLLLALTHGLNGAKIVIDDYVHGRGWRVAVLSCLGVLGAVLMVMGAFTILTFTGKS
jgi:succinate dehydrogenase / fumarate reductase membrane anchor subunit